MTIAYTWTVDGLECYPQVGGLSDVVFRVRWAANGFDGTYNASVQGVQNVPAPSENAFTPYPDLIEMQVIQWVLDELGAERVESFKADVATKIAEMITPPVVTPPLPWVELVESN
jgi:hypothetical protein